MKQIRNYVGIALAVLVLPGGLPITLAVWLCKRRAQSQVVANGDN